jgi:PIN domain nuclease of toxin-antitoxin system
VKYLLDTHVLLWWLGAPDRLSAEQRSAVEGAGPERPLLVSGISLWEIAMLAELGRIELEMPLRDWLEAATAAPLVQLTAITPAIAAEVAALPASFHRDPADRMLVATARVLQATLVTSDRRIRDAGIVATLG